MTSTLPLIIEPADFAAMEKQGNWIIIDLSQEANYLAGHIPGALHVPPSALVCGIPPAAGKIASQEQLEALFSHLNLNDDTHYFVYDDEGGGWAGRFIWTLDVIGHRNYSYINGGIHAWKSEGLPLEQTRPEYPSRPTTVRIDSAQVVEAEDIIHDLDTLCIWDARSPQEHSGEKVVSMRGGHIPGAINAEWTSLMDPQRGLRIRNDAQNYLKQLGIDGSRPIVTHCQGHHRSGFTYLVGKYLGFDIKAYHGSWSEWGNREDTPIETGA